MNEEVVISLKNVTKSYKLFSSKTDRMKEALDPFKRKFHKEFNALNCLNFEVKRGEIVGIVGMNGAGKSTLLKLIAGIIQQSSGSVYVKGNIVPLLELGSGFNPEYTGVENIYFYNTIMGYSRKETDKMLDRIVDFAEIGDFIDQPLKTYSSGMRARLAFAVAVNIDPDILILDEVLSVGDELFRRKSFSKIEEFFKAGKTILFVSHSSQNVNQLCSRAIFLYNGKIVLDGDPKEVTMNYTKFLFSTFEQRQRFLENTSLLLTSDIGIRLNDRIDLFDDCYQNSPEKILSVVQPLKKKSEAFFIDNFKPKSTVILNNANIHVSDFHIITPEGEQVNCLVSGEEYIIGYSVHFHEDIGHISHGIGVKTTHGVALSWRFYPDTKTYSSEFYGIGDILHIKWRFYCRFMPGIYFLGLTIKKQGIEGPDIVFKGADIDVFKVLGEKGFDRGGFFDTGFQLVK